MITIHKPVRRVTVGNYAHHGRPLVAMLEPGDLLAMRLKGKRTTYRGSLHDLFAVLARWHVERLRRERAEKRKLAKAMR